LNRIQQILIAKGFRQELDCSRFHGCARSSEYRREP
jgi:hypothetical protein